VGLLVAIVEKFFGKDGLPQTVVGPWNEVITGTWEKAGTEIKSAKRKRKE
jgi:hypothetical protein